MDALGDKARPKRSTTAGASAASRTSYRGRQCADKRAMRRWRHGEKCTSDGEGRLMLHEDVRGGVVTSDGGGQWWWEPRTPVHLDQIPQTRCAPSHTATSSSPGPFIRPPTVYNYQHDARGPRRRGPALVNNVDALHGALTQQSTPQRGRKLARPSYLTSYNLALTQGYL
jgi:hypothetical protein